MMPRNKKGQRAGNGKAAGMTIIEGLILLTIFSMATMTFYEGFALGTEHVLNAKKRLLAVGIATEQMEILRSLPYEDVAVVGGTPNGSLDPDENVTASGHPFHLLMSISYVDDPDDGTAALGTDLRPNDYKLAVVRVFWGGETASEMVALRSNFIPSGLETDAGGGVLSVNVIDAGGNPISNASVRIQNNAVVPAVDTTLVTGGNGNVMLVGAAASSQNYQVTVTKAGYETVTTMPPYPTTPYYPMDVHMTAVNDAFTTGTLVSSPHSDLSLRFRDPLGDPVGDVNFDIEGGRAVGVTPAFDPVYGFTDSLVSTAAGDLDMTDLATGAYRITLNEPGFSFWKVDYGSTNEVDQVVLDSGVALTATVIVMDETVDAFFVRIVDDSNGNPVEGAGVRLENLGLTYDVEETTDLHGYAYFPRNTAAALTNGATYDITVTHADYDTKTGTVTINALTTDTIQVTPN